MPRMSFMSVRFPAGLPDVRVVDVRFRDFLQRLRREDDPEDDPAEGPDRFHQRLGHQDKRRIARWARAYVEAVKAAPGMAHLDTGARMS